MFVFGIDIALRGTILETGKYWYEHSVDIKSWPTRHIRWPEVQWQHSQDWLKYQLYQFAGHEIQNTIFLNEYL